jgi:hypothetical protein
MTGRIQQRLIGREFRRPESTPGLFPNRHCLPQELLELEILAAELPYSGYK